MILRPFCARIVAMNQRGFLFSVMALPIDIAAWLGGYILAYFFRANLEIVPVSYIWPFWQYFQFIIFLLPLFLLTMTLEGLYNYRYAKKGFGLISSIFIAASAAVMYVVLWVFFTRGVFFSRLLIVYAWLFSFILLVFGRWLLQLLRSYLLSRRIGLRTMIVFGSPEAALAAVTPLINSPKYGYRLSGLVGNINPGNNYPIKYLGDIDRLSQIIKKNKADDLMIVESNLRQSVLSEIASVARDTRVTLRFTPSAMQLGGRNIASSTLAGLPTIEILETPLEGWGRIAKRFFDILGSLLFIVLFSWLYLIVAIIVKLTSKGPIFFKDVRIGDKGEFSLYKFRTFKIEYCTGREYGGKKAEEYENELIKNRNTRVGPIPKIKNDPRVTSVGNILRKLSLDELPQFFNALKGDMSIVGPRPHRPKEISHYKDQHKKLLIIKPGITGMAQISGRSDLDFDKEAELDIYYINNWSLWLDVQILALTVVVVLKLRGAY